MNKKQILNNICYTQLVYWRINKKLKISLEKEEIEKFIYKTITETDKKFFTKIWKNYYIQNTEIKLK